MRTARSSSCDPLTSSARPSRRAEYESRSTTSAPSSYAPRVFPEVSNMSSRYALLITARYPLCFGPVKSASETLRYAPRAMDFEFTSEQQAFRQTVRDFAEKVIGPRAEEMDETGEFPVDIVLQMGELGLFGLPFPEVYGGAGADFSTLCIAIEELARIDSSMAITLEAGVGLGARPLYLFGSEEQKQRWLGPLARGEKIAGFGLTEPEAGSDSGNTKTTAELRD